MMRTYEVDTITALANDRLQVVGHWIDAQGQAVTVTASGWVSATTNHYPPESYDAETGHRHDGATARHMSEAELVDYARGLLAEQDPDPEPVVLYTADS